MAIIYRVAVQGMRNQIPDDSQVCVRLCACQSMFMTACELGLRQLGASICAFRPLVCMAFVAGVPVFLSGAD